MKDNQCPVRRPSPLRITSLTLPPGLHPERRTVDLSYHVHTDGRTFLLDHVTGLLYVATPYILAVTAAAGADAAAAAAAGLGAVGLLGAGGPPPTVGPGLATAALSRRTAARAGLMLSPRQLASPRHAASPTRSRPGKQSCRRASAQHVEGHTSCRCHDTHWRVARVVSYLPLHATQSHLKCPGGQLCNPLLLVPSHRRQPGRAAPAPPARPCPAAALGAARAAAVP